MNRRKGIQLKSNLILLKKMKRFGQKHAIRKCLKSVRILKDIKEVASV